MHPERSVAIFWDYGESLRTVPNNYKSETENCSAPSSISGYDLVNSIRRTAHCYGTVKLFKAYLDNSQHTSTRALSFKSELQSSGVSLTDCPHNGKKNVCDIMMIGMLLLHFTSTNSCVVDMLAHAIDNPNPWTYILITGDRDFAYATSVLRLRKYEVVLISSPIPKPHVSLRSQANMCLDWNDHIIQNTTCHTEATLVSPSSMPPPAVRHVSVGIQLEGDGLQKGITDDRRRSVGVQDDRFLSCVNAADEKQAFDPMSVSAAYQTLFTASINALISTSNESVALDAVLAVTPPLIETVTQMQDDAMVDPPLQSPASDTTTRMTNSPETAIASPSACGEKPTEPHSPTILPNMELSTPELKPSDSNACSYDIASLQLTSTSTSHDSLSCYMSASSTAKSSSLATSTAPQPPTALPIGGASLCGSESSTTGSSSLATNQQPISVSSAKPLPTEFLHLARVLEKFRLAGISCPLRTAVANELSKDGKVVKKIYAPYHPTNKPFARYTEAAIKADVIVTGGTGGKEWISLRSAWHGRVS